MKIANRNNRDDVAEVVLDEQVLDLRDPNDVAEVVPDEQA